MKTKRLLQRITALLCAAVLTACVPSANTMAKTSKTTVSAKTLQSGLQFTLTGMPYNGAYSPIPATYKGASFTIRSVQNFAFSPDNQYVFTVSEGYSGNIKAGKKHTILVCSALPSASGKNAKATFAGYKILDNFGHGETIAVTQSSTAGAYDIWVACTPNNDKDQRFGINIIRLTCMIPGNGTIQIKKQVKLSFDNVKLDGQKLIRDRMGVAVNPSANKIAFRFHTNHGTYLQIYDFNGLNKKLNAAKNKATYKMSNKAPQKLLQAEIRCDLIPHGTFQSFDIDDKYFYVCGGHMNIGASIYKIKYKTSKNGQAKTQRLGDADIAQNITITPQIKVESTTLKEASLEIEGMKIQSVGSGKVNYYINFFMANTPIADTIGIYKFQK